MVDKSKIKLPSKAAGVYAAFNLDKTTKNLIAAFQKQHKLKNGVGADDLHVTTVYSKKPIAYVPHKMLVKVSPATYEYDLFGDGNALVLKFESLALQRCWREAMRLGGTWDYESYHPHITLAKNVANIDINKLPLPRFNLILCDEHVEPIDLE